MAKKLSHQTYPSFAWSEAKPSERVNLQLAGFLSLVWYNI